MNQDQYDKLPKYAQRWVDKLEADVEYYKEQLVKNYSGESSISWIQGLDFECGIPEDAAVIFRTNSGRIRVYLKDNSVYAYTDEGKLAVIPNSSNTVFIEVKER